jgi:predicted ATP-grasp superfamily ATP-dependent carboligase
VTQVPAVILGSGITALGVLRVLGRAGIPAYLVETEDPMVRRSRWFRALPSAVPPTRRDPIEGWLATLPFSRAVLVPCSDYWARAVAGLAPGLKERFPASTPALAPLEALLDKGRLADALDREALPRPESHAVTRADDLDAIPDEFFQGAFLKPRESQPFLKHFGVKGFRVTSRADARERLEMASAAGFEVIFQYYIPGPPSHHYFVDGFIDRDGVERALFVRQRLRMYPPLFGNSTYMRSIAPDAVPEAVQTTRRLLRGLGYRGMYSAELKLDARDGLFKLLEVNARAWWYVEFAAQCGVDVVRMAYDDALGEPVRPSASYAIDRRCVYPYNDWFACGILRDSGQMSALDIARSWVGAHQPVFEWSDPWPAVMGTLRVLRGKLRLGRRVNGGDFSTLPDRAAPPLTAVPTSADE